MLYRHLFNPAEHRPAHPGQARLLTELAYHGSDHGLAGLDPTTRQRPETPIWFGSPPHEKYSVVIDGDRTHAQFRSSAAHL